MNLALPAVLIILGLLPGIVFFHSYFSGRFPRGLAGISAVSEVALYVVFAIPLGLLALKILSASGVYIDFRLLSRLMVAVPTQETATALGRFLDARGPAAAGAYLLTLLGALVLGNLSRRIVWATRLDVISPFMRLKHEWFYTITGRLRSLPRGVSPYAELTVQQPDGVKVFRGLVVHFENDRDGKLEQLILADTHKGTGAGQEFAWRPLGCHKFVVTGQCIQTISMTYILVKKVDPPAGWWGRLRFRARQYWRSFFYQEP